MTILLVEESEAAKQAKLKGYVSIGFGRWADKFGNMVAFTTKTGRLAPYTKQSKEPGSDTTSPGQEPDGTPPPPAEAQPPAQVGVAQPPGSTPSSAPAGAPVSAESHRAAQEYQAGKYAAEALLELLRQIEDGNITDEGLRFYTSKPFRAYALVLKMAVKQIDSALEQLLIQNHSAISKNHGIVTFDLQTISEKAKLHPTVAHMALIDLSTEGPSYTFAKLMQFDHAVSVEKYNRPHRLLTFEYAMEDLIRLEIQYD